jgi:hypothetical protein
MKVSKIIKSVTLITAVLFSATVLAYTPEMNEQDCKKPKFREFSLPEYKAPDLLEVPPESEFSFTLSVWANPETIKLAAKKQPLPFTVETTTTYHRVKAKLPASLNGQFVRIDVSVKALLGCDDQTGWLIKVAEKKQDLPVNKEAVIKEPASEVPVNKE